MKSEYYFKLIILIVVAFLIYSSIREYRYNTLLEEGISILQLIHKKGTDIPRYSSGYISAEEKFNRAKVILPERDEAFYYLGLLYFDFLNADFDYKVALSTETGLSDDSAEKNALENLKRSLEINPYNVDAMLTLAWLYEHLGMGNESDRLIARAEGISGGKLRIKMRILEWKVLRKDFDRVKKILNEISTINPSLVYNSLNIIWRVEKNYGVLKDIVPRNKKSREVFAKFLKSKGMTEEAKIEEEMASSLE